MRYGDQSFEEMCFCFMSITPEKPGDMRELQQAMFQMFLPGEMERRAWKEEDKRERKRKREAAAKAKAEAKAKAKAKPTAQRRRYF